MSITSDFEKRFKIYTDGELDDIADVLFQEVEMRYSSNQQTTRLNLGVIATINFSMRSIDVARCIEIMEARYAARLDRMNYAH